MEETTKYIVKRIYPEQIIQLQQYDVYQTIKKTIDRGCVIGLFSNEEIIGVLCYEINKICTILAFDIFDSEQISIKGRKLLKTSLELMKKQGIKLIEYMLPYYSYNKDVIFKGLLEEMNFLPKVTNIKQYIFSVGDIENITIKASEEKKYIPFDLLTPKQLMECQRFLVEKRFIDKDCPLCSSAFSMSCVHYEKMKIVSILYFTSENTKNYRLAALYSSLDVVELRGILINGVYQARKHLLHETKISFEMDENKADKLAYTFVKNRFIKKNIPLYYTFL